MQKIFILVGILLLLPISHAQTPPDPPSSASLQTLISSLSDVKQDVSTLKRDMQEFKQQLIIKLEQQQQAMLIFLAIFNIGYLFLLTIFQRIISWVVWKKRSREIQRHQDIVINNLQEINITLAALRTRLDNLPKNILPDPLPAEESGKWSKRQILIKILIPALLSICGVAYLWLIR